MISVYVPYTDLKRRTVEGLESTGRVPIYVDVSKSDESYFDLLSSLWRSGETFIIVEHDVVVRETTIAELESCERSWCAFGTPYFNGVHVGLGCVKFGSELIARFPRAFDEVAKMHDIKHPAKHWCRLDSWLQDRVLPTRERHIHEPSVGHLKETPKIHPSHGCL